MFERFTPGGRRAVIEAEAEARKLNHNFIGTEHILLGLLVEGEGIAAQALGDLSIGAGLVREEVEDIIGKGQEQPSGHIPFTPRAKKVLEYSLREALQLGHNYIGTEHVLLGLLRESQEGGVAADVLNRHTTIGEVRKATIERVSLAHDDLERERRNDVVKHDFLEVQRLAQDILSLLRKPNPHPELLLGSAALTGLRERLIEMAEQMSEEAIQGIGFVEFFRMGRESA